VSNTKILIFLISGFVLLEITAQDVFGQREEIWKIILLHNRFIANFFIYIYPYLCFFCDVLFNQRDRKQ